MCLHLQQASRIHRKCFRVFAHRDEKSVPCHKIEIEGSGIFVMDMMSKKGSDATNAEYNGRWLGA